MFDFDVVTGPGPLAAIAEKEARPQEAKTVLTSFAATAAEKFPPAGPDPAAPLAPLAGGES